MSETPKKLNLDTALREWPAVEGSREETAMDWENQAQKIEERLRSGATGSSAAYVSDEKLLADPLGQIQGEGHNSAAPTSRGKTAESPVFKGETMTMPADRERDRRSLQDLAKLAGGPLSGMTPPPPSVQVPHSSAPSGVQHAAEAMKDDSGIVDLAMAAQSDPHAAARAQSTPLANAGLFDDEPASVRPGPVSGIPGSIGLLAAQQLQQPAPSVPPFSAAPGSLPPASLGPASHASHAPVSSAPASFVPAMQASAVQSSAQHAAPVAQKKGKGVVIALVLGGLIAAGAVAAGGFFYIQQKAETAAAELALNTPPVAPVIAAPPAETAPATPTPEPSADPEELPEVAPETAVAAAPKGGAAKAPAAKTAKPAAAAKEESAKLSAKDLPTAPAGPEGDLGKAMGAAVGADGKPVKATPAAGNTGPQFAAGTVPQKPSQGAVTGAIGAVLPSARACLGPDDAVSRASITFTSVGTVQRVSVSGGAAGKPSEGCIKSALSRATVAPFAAATYTANITVRH